MIRYEGTRIYTAPFRQTSEEFDTKAEAMAYVEQAGSGRVITWHVGPNLPNALPKLKYSSCALDVCHEGVWQSIDIFSVGAEHD